VPQGLNSVDYVFCLKSALVSKRINTCADSGAAVVSPTTHRVEKQFVVKGALHLAIPACLLRLNMGWPSSQRLVHTIASETI
jgi:hypothetical protein